MQTAVNWLIEQMLINNYTSKQQIENAHWLINEAKEMEKHSYICSKCKSQINGNEVMQQMQGSEKSD